MSERGCLLPESGSAMAFFFDYDIPRRDTPMMNSFLKWWRHPSASSRTKLSSSRAAKRQRMPLRRLELEQLEDRIVPSVTLLSSYTGLDSAASGGFEPPDTQGAAGPSSVVETVNQNISIYTPKNTGATPVTDTLADFFFTQGGLANGGSSFGQSDPFTIYDPQVQRYIVGDIDFANANTNGDGNYLLLAVSKSDNPATLTSSDWYFNEVTTTESGVSLQDYPGNPGYNADALVVTLNSFSTTADLHTQVNAISMNSLINGTPLTLGSNLFQTDINQLLPRPTTMPDSTPGGPMWFVASAGAGGQSITGSANTIHVLEMTNVLSTTPTFTTTNLTVNPYYEAVSPLQPNGQPLTGPGYIDSRIMKAAERNGTLVASQITSDAAGDDDNASWYAINVGSGTPTLQQQGDVSGGPGVYNTYPAIDINAQGDFGMTFMSSGTSAGQYESMYVTGRTPSDPAGTMETPVLVQAGTSNYNGTRQGDMSGINVDANGSFWAFSQWANNEAAPNWGTAIGNFTLAPPISILAFSAVEGTPFTDVPVATFLDNSGVPLSSYNATISWGDGTSSAGTVVATSSNTFNILGSHTYAEEGNYTVTVSENNGTTTLGPVSGVISVADAPLTGSAQVINTQAGDFVSNALVAIFTDTDPLHEPVSDYTATIVWSEGDGLTFSSTGTIVTYSGNTFAVFGSSPYSFASGGLFPLQVTIRDDGGAAIEVGSVLNIAHNSAIPPLIPLDQADVGPPSNSYAAMEDALTNFLKSEQLFVFALSFGSMAEKQGSFGNFVNAFFAYQRAVFAFDMQLPGA